MPNDKWIHFPKNPYDGQIFYYPPTKDIFEDGFKTKAQAYDWIMSLIPNKDSDCVFIKRSNH